MPAPPILWCLVCEDVRIEARQLVSLLGFYGVAPDVEIAIRNFGAPIERLAFYIGAKGESDGQLHRYSLEVREPGGSLVVGPAETAPEGQPPPPGVNIKIAFIFTTINMATPRSGVYSIVIKVDGKEHYKSSFIIRQGRPEELVGDR